MSATISVHTLCRHKSLTQQVVLPAAIGQMETLKMNRNALNKQIGDKRKVGWQDNLGMSFCAGGAKVLQCLLSPADCVMTRQLVCKGCCCPACVLQLQELVPDSICGCACCQLQRGKVAPRSGLPAQQRR